MIYTFGVCVQVKIEEYSVNRYSNADTTIYIESFLWMFMRKESFFQIRSYLTRRTIQE